MLPASIDPLQRWRDDGVDLVDEDDQAVGVVADLVDHALEALLELAAVLRPGDHAGHVERH